MANKTIGMFLSDIHLPDEINLKPVFSYMKDLYKQTLANKDKFLLVLGGDIIDAQGMHGIDSLAASQIKLEWYDRDCKLLSAFLKQVQTIVPKAEVVYLEGNHEERYRRIMRRYPDAFGGRFDFNKDIVSKLFPKSKWIPYGDYESYFKLGDTIFTHGTIYPQNHAKKYAEVFAPFKVVYGHLHHFQAYTMHSAMPELAPHYTVTAGCLTHTAPEWKKGQPNCWVNGFIDFFSDGTSTTSTPHLIDVKGRFCIGGKIYE
jgi:UDP-2,3-diacylglucosamine pyrophosphatase LpxH